MSPDELQCSKMRTLYRGWDECRQGQGLVPMRTSFRPMALGRILPDVSLLKREACGDYRYCLLGSDLNARMGVNPVGVNVLDFVDPKVRSLATSWYETALAHPCGVFTHASVEFEGQNSRELRSFYLPMLGRNQTNYYFLHVHSSWAPEFGVSYGNLVGVGGALFDITPVDIGAGVPDCPLNPDAG